MNTGKTLRMLALVAVLAGLALGLGSVPTAQAATLCVNPGGTGGCYSSIQAAINAASSGDTIDVEAGTYVQGGTQLLINKSITVRAKPGLLVRPKIVFNYGDWNKCAVQIAADNVVFEGFEVDNSAHWGSSPRGYLVGDYNSPRNGWTIRNNDIHHGRNAIRPIGNNVTIEYNDLHETESDLINCEYGTCYGLKVTGNWLHSHHSDMGGKPAGLTYNVSSTSGADVEVTYNYAWANRTFIDFQNNGGLSPANHILVAHNTVDYWIGDLPDPIVGTENAEQMSIAWWSDSGNWNGPNFEIRDNLFTRQKWYAVVDTDSLLLGQIILQNNLFWQWYLNDTWYPAYAYPNEWPGQRGAVGWENMGAGNEFVMIDDITGDPLYAATGATPDEYYALTCGSPAYGTASDGTNIGAWQGTLVCGVRPVKQGVLDDLIALRATVTDKQDGDKLDEAIKHLTKSLDPDLWIDGSHPEPKHGEKVFNEEKDAVNKLRELIKDQKSTIPDATLQDFIDPLVGADRQLAVVAIADAAGGDPKDIAKANEELAKGDSEAADGKYTDAIEHYRNAWKHALKAME
jgi:hypothetical protein